MVLKDFRHFQGALAFPISGGRKVEVYLNKNTRLLQVIVAVLCLRPEEEISFVSLIDDLFKILGGKVDPRLVHQNLEYIRRGDLISINWNRRVIKRRKQLNDYALNYVAKSEIWDVLAGDWSRVNKVIQDIHGKTNLDFKALLSD